MSGESNRNNKIVVVGSCMMDFVSYSPRLPKPGETIHGKKFVVNFGGKGANQCVAAAKLGAAATLVAAVGDDQWGEKYIKNLNDLNINCEHVKIKKGADTGIAQINVSDSGENQIIIVAGANNKLNPKDIDDSKEIISSAAVLVMQLETTIEVALRAMHWCNGISILNGAPAIKLTESDSKLLQQPTIFCVNESEASIFTGLSVTNQSEAKIAALRLLDLGCVSVIITMGADGAIFVHSSDRDVIHVITPVVQCKDSTGAGDAFIGALAFLLANQQSAKNMKDAIKVACEVAADSVTREGTQISFPGPEILS